MLFGAHRRAKTIMRTKSIRGNRGNFGLQNKLGFCCHQGRCRKRLESASLGQMHRSRQSFFVQKARIHLRLTLPKLYTSRKCSERACTFFAFTAMLSHYDIFCNCHGYCADSRSLAVFKRRNQAHFKQETEKRHFDNPQRIRSLCGLLKLN